MNLLDLTFSDLYVGENLATSHFKVTPDSRHLQTLPSEVEAELLNLRQMLESHPGKGEFSITWPISGPNSERLRVKPMNSVLLKPLFILGRLQGRPGTLTEIGFPSSLVTPLLSEIRRDGLVLLFGKMGSGKTTSAYSFVIDFTLRHGGLTFTVENPIERLIEGPYGDGFIRQTEVSSDDEARLELNGMLRTRADLIKAPEVRTDETAHEVLLLARSGSLVVADTHGQDLPNGLARFAAMTGNQNEAIADALSAAFHLSLKNISTPPDTFARGKLPGRPDAPKKQLTVTPLLVTLENRAQIRSFVASGNFAQLGNEIERQKRMFMTGRVA